MRFAWLLLLVAVATAAAILFLPREITLVAGQWVVRVHSVLALALLLLLLGVLYLLFGMYYFARYAPLLWRLWRRGKRQGKRAGALEEGLRLLMQNDWRKASKVLAAGAELSDAPGVYYLGAAQAEHYLGRGDASSRLLEKAMQSDPAMAMSSMLTRARLLESVGDRRGAIAALQPQALASAKGHETRNYMLQMLCAEGEWQQVLQQLDGSGLDKEQKESIRRRAWTHLLRQARTTGDGSGSVQDIWARMPRRLRRDDGMLAEYVSACLRLGAGAGCERLLKSRLRKKGLPLPRELVMLYGRLPTSNAEKSLSFVESLLQRQPTHPALLCVAGILCMRTGQRQRGISYFEASQHMEPDPGVHQVMAVLYEQQGDKDKALQSYEAAAKALPSEPINQEMLSLVSMDAQEKQQ